MSEIQSAYQEEEQRLSRVLRDVEQQLSELTAIPIYQGHDYTEQVLESVRELRRQNLSKALVEPYFGRLDFQSSGQDTSVPVYIGKTGVDDPDGSEPLVIDWRAPIASLFYSFTGGKDPVSYESPEGSVEGLVYLKRNLVIRQQMLQRVVDTFDRHHDNEAVTDEFLLYRLGENKDNKLRDIVSTIQAEQDKIIRAGKQTAMIIQGVAGSGKTTVALHRLAYLLYQYRDQVKAHRMMIFAPNRMFLTYISSVLPELGVGDIQQNTFSDWALALLDTPLELADPGELYDFWFSCDKNKPSPDQPSAPRFKGSISFMKLLNEAFTEYETNGLPKEDFVPWQDGPVLLSEQIEEWYKTEYKHYPLAKRRERVIARIKRWTEQKLEQLWEMKKKKECKKTANQRIRAFQTLWREASPVRLYTDLMDKKAKKPFFSDRIKAKIPDKWAAETVKLLRKKQIKQEDLAPLVYFYMKLYGLSSSDTFDHVVVDEAQDFSPFQIRLLDQFVKGHSFTILGDLSQAIYYYQGIRHWNEFKELFPVETTAYAELQRSYRSTMEIIQFANEILKRSGQTERLAVPVFRSGDRIRISKLTEDLHLPSLMNTIAELRQGNIQTLALLTRTAEQALIVHEQVISQGLSANLITYEQKDYEGGISVLPVYLSKGLEFDAVLLMQADDISYTASIEDARLLYVGCTRALHKLSVHYSGRPSPLLPLDSSEWVEIVDGE